MPSAFYAYLMLFLAIVTEVLGTMFLVKSQQFSRLVPTLAMAAFYILSMYLLSQAIRTLPIGLAYAIWAGLGIVLTALIGIFVFRQPLDLPGMIGMTMIVGGVIVVNLFSTTGTH